MYRNVVVDQTDVIRILHVDDDMSQGEFLKYFLPVSDGTFSISAVSDPNQALKELRKNRFDCVVTDYQMPDLNGIELAAMIRKEFDIPIIIYTGQGSEEVAEAAFSVGIDDYLRKEMDPSHYQVLAKRIRSVVEKKRVDTLYRTVIEQTRDALIISVDKKVVFANKAFLDLLGVSDGSELQNPFNFAVGEDKQRALNRFKEVIEKGRSEEYNQYRLKRKDGKIIQVEVSTSPVTYNGKIGVLSFVRDITEKNRLEAEKRETQERLQSLVELAPDGIITLDLKGDVTSVNSAFCRITGYESQEVLGKSFIKLKSIRSSDLKNYFRVFSGVLRGNLPPPFEFKYVSKDGKMGWGEAHIALINVSGKKELIAILRDITERKRSEENGKVPLGPTLELPSETNNTLLLSIGQLAYLIGSEIIYPMRHVKYLCEEASGDQNKFRESLPEITNTLDMALKILEGFLSRTDETIFKPSEKSVIDLVLDTLNQPKNRAMEVNTRHVGEIVANVDDSRLCNFLSTILQKVSDRVGTGKMDLLVESSESFVKLVFSNILDESSSVRTLDVINSISKDPEIILCREEVVDVGGKLELAGKASNPFISLTLPTYMKSDSVSGIPELDTLFRDVRETV
ncbi:MAG: PAS domain S-box protein [Candidatus Bathyarchaeota archaeon]